ncbi:hypothetical protein [Paenibacillus silvisoli]|uniref:hypothetical protein n=1 Tax=Paenibacillus silvisoli TaxID=3110539 RepID=UPI0028060855|nr:hypothetical protein [Paenibacillus silvisoli]
MKLEEIASRLSDRQKEAFAQSPIWRTDGTWPDEIMSRCGAKRAWRALPSEAAYALEAAVSAFGPIAFSEEQLLAAARPGVAGAELRVGLLQLMDAGILFAVRKGWGEKQYVIPSDAFPIWYEAMADLHYEQNGTIMLVPEQVEAWEVVASEADSYTPPFSLQCVYAMAEMVNSGMKRTAKGQLTKRTIQKSTSQLFVHSSHLADVAEAVFASTADETGEPPYPLQLSLFLDIAASQGWLVTYSHAYALREETWQDWLNRPLLRRESELLHYMLEQLSDKSTAAAVGAAALCLLPPYEWFRLDDVEELLALRQAQAAITKPIISTLPAWCSLLRALGWMESAADEQGRQVIRWLLPAVTSASAAEGDEDERFSTGLPQITPDGDIYVPGDCSYAFIWQLERLTARKRTDHIAVYRLDRRSLKPVATSHFSGQELIAFLENASEAELPETVRVFIADEFADGLTVTLQGYDPAASLPPMPAEQPACAAKGYELLTERLPVKALFSGIDDVPPMWLKQLRAYHSSTRRELMEQALSWRTPVKLSCEGDVRPFVPERIVDADGGWSVVGHFRSEGGFSPAELKPEMWQEMMLVLPADFGSI